MEFFCRCHLTTDGITSLTLLPFGLWAPADIDLDMYSDTLHTKSIKRKLQHRTTIEKWVLHAMQSPFHTSFVKCPCKTL